MAAALLQSTAAELLAWVLLGLVADVVNLVAAMAELTSAVSAPGGSG